MTQNNRVFSLGIGQDEITVLHLPADKATFTDPANSIITFHIHMHASFHPDDLKDLDFISFSVVPDQLELRKGKSKSKSYWGHTAIVADSMQTVRKLAVHGRGISALPYCEAERDLNEKRLAHVLPDWSDRVLGIYIVWPRNVDLNLATREFINYMSAE